jgi:hypothetical protein
MKATKIFTLFVSFIAMVSMLFAPLATVAANTPVSFDKWPVDVTQPGWTATGMTNILGNGVWDGLNTVDGSSHKADFVIHYQQLNIAAHWGVCPAGWEVDPANEGQCRQLVGIPATYHEAVTHEITVIDTQAWDETIVDKEGYWTTIIDTPGYTIHHDAITHVEHQTSTRTWVETTYKWETTPKVNGNIIGYICPSGWDLWEYGNKHECRRWLHSPIDATPVYAQVCPSGYEEHNGTCRKQVVDVEGHWGDWSDWGNWTLGACPGTGRVSCPAPETRCQERTVIDKAAWDEEIPPVTHQEWVPPVTHIVHHEAITHQETIIDVPAYYSCEEGYILDGQTCSKYVYQDREWVTDTYSYMDVEYTVNIDTYIEPKPIWLQLWVCADGSPCFNVTTPPNPDGGCFIYDLTGEVIPTSAVSIYCDPDPAANGFTLLYSGWVRLPSPGNQQMWGPGGEGDTILAKLNADNRWHLAYMWFFPGYNGH